MAKLKKSIIESETGEGMLSIVTHSDDSLHGGAQIERGLGDIIPNIAYKRADVPAQRLKQNIEAFLRTLSDVVGSLPTTMGGFQVNSLTVSVEVNAKGAVSLLGTGGEIGGKGGLTFVLTRKGAAATSMGDGHGAVAAE